MTLILDGGMSRELIRLGAPFRQPEWSALALMEAPGLVRQAHENFREAGAAVLTTNSYALVPFHIGAERFTEDGERLADLAGRMAREAAGGTAQVAGSLPPLFGSYHPENFRPAEAPALLAVLVRGLSPHVDLWLGETLSSTAEAAAVAAALRGDDRPLWISYTLRDDAAAVAEDVPPALRSGESVTEAVAAARRLGAVAVLFNCSQAEAMRAALHEARQADAAMTLGVYANAFVPVEARPAANEGLSGIRADLDPAAYAAMAQGWAAEGATIIGGCCGIGPAHIAELARVLS